MRHLSPTGRALAGALPTSRLCLINEAEALSRTYRLAAVPCPSYPGCFRWIVSSSDGIFSEQSTYPYATKAAAMIVGRIRMADLSGGRQGKDPLTPGSESP